MTKSSRFFSDGSYYNQPDFAKLMRDTRTDGYVEDIGDELEVLATDPVSLTLTVGTGRCYIQGYSFDIETDVELVPLQPADTSLPRIDRIVARLSIVSEKRIDVAAVKGTPAAEPVAPELTRNDDIYEISLATVYVAPYSTFVKQENITDTREKSYPQVKDASHIDRGLMSKADKIRLDELGKTYIGAPNPSSSLGIDGDIYVQVYTD